MPIFLTGSGEFGYLSLELARAPSSVPRLDQRRTEPQGIFFLPHRKRVNIMRRYVAAFLPLILSVGQAQADFIPVPIDSLTNGDLRTYTNGTNYPIAPTILNVGGVDFSLVPFGMAPNSLGLIQTPVGPSLFTISTNIFGPNTVYTLINSAFGEFGAVNGRLEFVGTGGAFASFDLTQGFNIRDHFNGFFNNIVTDPTIVTANFGGDVRLDRQTFVLPASFSTQTLTEIRLVGTNSGNPGEGEAFLAAATVQTPASAVPEPSSLTLLAIGGLGVVGWIRRRNRVKA
jgi:hypothetical protein